MKNCVICLSNKNLMRFGCNHNVCIACVSISKREFCQEEKCIFCQGLRDIKIKATPESKSKCWC